MSRGIDVRSLLASAEDLLVGAIAQEPFCADPGVGSPRSTYEAACHMNFDMLPVHEAGRVMSRVIDRNALRDAGNWTVLGSATIAGADILVARDAPAFSLLDRFDASPVLFTLGRHGIDGVVTIYDLNQPAAHLLGFGFALICEAEVTAVVRQFLGADSDHAAHLVRQARGNRTCRRWETAHQKGEDIHIATTLTFGDKLELMSHYHIADLSQRLGEGEDALLRCLHEINQLRNAIGHYKEEMLSDSRWVFTHMQQAERLARRIAEVTS
jgi:hypothetical protein